MAKAELQVTLREGVGKGVARSLRRQGLVPAVVYGKEMEARSLSLDPKDLEEAISTKAGWNTLITLKGEEGVDGKVVILKDMDVHPIRREVQHVDFYALDLSKKIHVMVPVVPTGKSEGEKMGGSLQVVRKELEVVCLPTAIPQAIEIDVAALKIGDVVHVEDIVVPQGVEIPHEVNFTVITVTGIKAEEVEGEEEAAEEAEAAAE